MTVATKKFLDSAGLTYFAQLLNNYPDNEVLASVINAISDALDEKAPLDLATSSTAGLMSAIDKQVVDNLNPNVSVTIDNMAVEQLHIINAKQENLLSFEGIIEPQISAQIRTDNLLNVNENITPGYYLGSNGSQNTNANDIMGDFISVTPGQDIYYTGIIGPTSSSSINRRLHVYNSNKTWIKQMSFAGSLKQGQSWSTHAVVPSNGAYVRVSWGSTDTNVMISVGAPSKYFPYYITPYLPLQNITFYNSSDGTVENGNTYTENLPLAAGNVYSLKFNPILGKIWVTSGHIASYNGETLSGEWWSDRDTYEAGASPTTGAEVVYALDEEDYIEYDASTVTVPLYYQNNYFWIENGLITLLTYYAETLAAHHMTVYDGVTFGDTHIVESDIANWNHAAELIDDKANLDGPIFTAVPQAPTPGVATNSTRMANTEFVQRALGNNIAYYQITNKADNNYSIGDYLMMNGLLYKVTAAIAKAATITPGTNVQQTTITDELKSLFSSI